MRKNVGIIGAGLGGMASAIHMRKQGYEVTLFEAGRNVGGKMGQISHEGYRFDLGPSVFTMPGLVDRLFEQAGENPGDFYQYDKLDQSCRYFYEDGTIINAYSEPEAFIEELRKKTGETPDHVRKFLQRSHLIYNLTSDLFMFHSIHDPGDLLKKRTLKSLMGFRNIGAFSTMHQANRKQFESDKVVQLFDRYATYNGSDPYRAPATFNIISHLEHNKGVYYPEDGIYSIASGLFRLLKKLNVHVRFNERVRELMVKDNRVDELITDSGNHSFDHVISNMDVTLFYEHLLKDDKMLEKTKRPERSSSALIFYWGVNGRFPEMALHNILFSGDYPREFEYLFGMEEIYADPTVYIYISSRVVANDAPPDRENWYVMVNAPADRGQDWSHIRRETKRNILSKIWRVLGISLQNHIESERVYDPPALAEDTVSFQGALYGNSSNSRFAAFNRHPNYRKKYRNLYFTGGSVHPGGGIPLCIAGAGIVSEKIRKHDTKQR